MPSATYQERRGQLETYFDRTASEAWTRLTSDAPVSRIRATVRAGRDAMRQTLLDQLPDSLEGRRVLDAGCGTGAFAIEAARRGAVVTAIDISPSLIDIARKRMPATLGPGSIDFHVGDMLDPTLGEFDHVIAMDSLIHYQADDIVRIVTAFAERTARSIHLTFAPKTPALAVMHAVGRLIPHREHRAPAIQPVSERDLRALIRDERALAAWRPMESRRISSGFYTSQALELNAA